MTYVRELAQRRRVALLACDRVPRPEVRDVLNMLGLIPLEQRDTTAEHTTSETCPECGRGGFANLAVHRARARGHAATRQPVPTGGTA